jgi:hypothetical protein
MLIQLDPAPLEWSSGIGARLRCRSIRANMEPQ